ncbi:MAG: hypothetical protein E7496_11475 [Ruminococcus sp.]|nr:hypothetical protein [Ruminococcus sp.]
MNRKKMITAVLTVAFLLTGCASNAKAQTTESIASDENSKSESVKKTEVIAAVNSEPSAGWNPVTGYGQRYDPVLQSTLTKAYGGEIT